MQFLAGLEADGFARSDADFGSGARIAADAGFAWADVEDAEAAQLDALTLSKSALEGFKDCVDGGFRLIALEAGAFNHLVNNVLFYQCVPPTSRLSEFMVSVESFSIIVNAADLP
jgi:hypothetical protein